MSSNLVVRQDRVTHVAPGRTAEIRSVGLDPGLDRCDQQVHQQCEAVGRVQWRDVVDGGREVRVCLPRAACGGRHAKRAGRRRGCGRAGRAGRRPCSSRPGPRRRRPGSGGRCRAQLAAVKLGQPEWALGAPFRCPAGRAGVVERLTDHFIEWRERHRGPANWAFAYAKTTNKPQATDLGFHSGAGDENRTRALSLGSDGACMARWSLTCADSSCWHRCGPDHTAVDRGCPLLRARYGHGARRPLGRARAQRGTVLGGTRWDVHLGNACARAQSWVMPVLRCKADGCGFLGNGRRSPLVHLPASGPYHWSAWPVTAAMHSKSRSRCSSVSPCNSAVAATTRSTAPALRCCPRWVRTSWTRQARS